MRNAPRLVVLLGSVLAIGCNDADCTPQHRCVFDPDPEQVLGRCAW